MAAATRPSWFTSLLEDEDEKPVVAPTRGTSAGIPDWFANLLAEPDELEAPTRPAVLTMTPPEGALTTDAAAGLVEPGGGIKERLAEWVVGSGGEPAPPPSRYAGPPGSPPLAAALDAPLEPLVGEPPALPPAAGAVGATPAQRAQVAAQLRARYPDAAPGLNATLNEEPPPSHPMATVMEALGNTARDIGDRLSRGQAAVTGPVGATIRTAGELGQRVPLLRGPAGPAAAVEALGSDIERMGAQQMAGSEQLRPGAPDNLAAQVVESVPSLAATMGATLAGAPALGLAGGMALGTGAAGAQSFGSAIQEAEEAGASEGEQLAAASWQAAGDMALEQLGEVRLAKLLLKGVPVGTLAEKLAGVTKTALLGGSEEFLQDLNSKASKLATYDEEGSFTVEDLRKAFQAGLAGMILEGTVGAGAYRGAPIPGVHEEAPVTPAAAEPEPAPVEAMAHAGSDVSPEAVNRVARGERYIRITPGGEVLPIINDVAAVDVRVNQGEVKAVVEASGGIRLEQGRPNVAQQRAMEALRGGPAAEVQALSPAEDVEPDVYELPDIGEGHTLYRGQERPWSQAGAGGELVYFFSAEADEDAAFDAASRYQWSSPEGGTMRAALGDVRVIDASAHPDFVKGAVDEGTGAGAAQSLRDLGADAFAIEEDGRPVIVVRRDSIHKLRNAEWLPRSAEIDAWEPVSLGREVPDEGSEALPDVAYPQEGQEVVGEQAEAEGQGDEVLGAVQADTPLARRFAGIRERVSDALYRNLPGPAFLGYPGVVWIPKKRGGVRPTALKEKAATPLPMPFLHEDLDPLDIAEAWDVASRRHPRLAAMVRRISPLPKEVGQASMDSDFELRVPVGKRLRPDILVHELTHLAQSLRGRHFPETTWFGYDESAKAQVRELESQAFRQMRPYRWAKGNPQAVEFFRDLPVQEVLDQLGEITAAQSAGSSDWRLDHRRALLEDELQRSSRIAQMSDEQLQAAGAVFGNRIDQYFGGEKVTPRGRRFGVLYDYAGHDIRTEMERRRRVETANALEPMVAPKATAETPTARESTAPAPPPIRQSPKSGRWRVGNYTYGTLEEARRDWPDSAVEPNAAPPIAAPEISASDDAAAVLALAQRLGRRPKIPEIQRELGMVGENGKLIEYTRAQKLWQGTKGFGARSPLAEPLAPIPPDQRQIQGDPEEAGFAAISAAPTAPRPPRAKFSDPGAEASFQEARRGIRPEPLLRRIRDGAVEIGHAFAREYRHVPGGERFARFRESLRLLSHQPNRAANDVARDLDFLKVMNEGQRETFDRKLLVDNLIGVLAAYGPNTPIPFLKPEALPDEQAKVDADVAADPTVQMAMERHKEAFRRAREELKAAYKEIGMDPEPLFRQGETYLHHQILEKAAKEQQGAGGAKMKKPIGRSWQRNLKGSALPFNLAYLQAQGKVLAEMKVCAAEARELAKMEAVYDIAPDVREAARQAKEKDWTKKIPEDYLPWQPQEGSVLFPAHRIVEQVAQDIITRGVAEVTSDQLAKGLMLGGPRKTLVLPMEIVQTLTELNERRNAGPGLTAAKTLSAAAQRAFKVAALFSPRRVIRYVTRNVIGDTQNTLRGNPSAVARFPQAAREIRDWYARGTVTPEMRAWTYRGGADSGLFAQEISDTERTRIGRLMDKTSLETFAKQLVASPLRAIPRAFRLGRHGAAFIESLNRYANYLAYTEQMRANPDGRPDNFGASRPEEVMALETIEDRAFWLSNQLIGAYDQVSEAGRAIREHLIPFYSFQELNIRTNFRLLRNALTDDGRIAEGFATRAFGRAVVRQSPFLAMKAGKYLALAYAFEGIFWAWNHLPGNDDEERDLPDEVKKQAHINLGRSANGEVRYFNRLSTFSEFREWFGVDEFGTGVFDYLDGRVTAADVAWRMLKQPVNKLIGSVSPIGLKGAFELITGEALFPDAFNPTEIEDRGEYLARLAGAEKEYKYLTGKPDRSGSYVGSLSEFVLYKAEPGAAAYYDSLGYKDAYLRSRGNDYQGSGFGSRTLALRNYKRALRYGQEDVALKYLAEYVELCTSAADPVDPWAGMAISMRRMDPLFGIAKESDPEGEEKYRAWLRLEERIKLDRAIQYYQTVLAAQDEFLETPEAQAIMEEGERRVAEREEE